MSDEGASDEIEDAGGFDTSDPKAVNRARKKAARIRAEQLDVVKALMAVENGRAWVYDILSFCRLFEEPFVVGVPDGTAFNLGRMNVGRRLLADIQECSPQEYLTMISEAKTRNDKDAQ